MEAKQAQEKAREEERIIRILGQDIEGKMSLYAGLAKIKGVSWAMSNAVCKTIGLDKKRRIGSLKEDEIKRISEFLKNPGVPKFLINRRFSFEEGEHKHLTGSDLELTKEFDIKRLKKIKSYRGIRHTAGLPLRGQRTRANFRRQRKKSVGIKSKIKK